MKKISLFLLFLAVSIRSNIEGSPETSDLDLLILQNPKKELQGAVERGYLEKLVRIAKLIEHNKVDLNIFQDPVLVENASKREEANNRYSKKYQFFRGFLCASLALLCWVPAGALKENSSLDYLPLMAKGMGVVALLWWLRLADDLKASLIKNARLVHQLVKVYHKKSLAS